MGLGGRARCLHRRRNRRPAAHIRRGARTRRAPGPEAAAINTAVALSHLSSRASWNASRKSKVTGCRAAIMRWNRPDSVLYLMLPIASGPMPSVPCGGELRAVRHHVQALHAGRRNGVDVGHDQKTLRLAPVGALERMRTPARPAQSAASACARIAAFSSSLPSATWTSSLEAGLDLAAPLRSRVWCRRSRQG